MKRLALAAASVLVLAGCADTPEATTAADQVPGLAQRLENVDDHLVDHAWRKARVELHAIVDAANEARAGGELDATAADRVVASAERLLAALPGTATATPTPTPTAAATEKPATNDPAPAPKPDKGGKGGKKAKGGKKH